MSAVMRYVRHMAAKGDGNAKAALAADEGTRPRREDEDVAEFNRKFSMLIGYRPQHLTKRKLIERARFLREELDEFIENAGLYYDDETGFEVVDAPQNLAGMADALVDIVYVAKGTAVMMGLGEVWPELWAEVQRANMAKERGVGKRGNLVDCIKPVGWVPPNHEAILARAGYDPEQACAEHDDPEHSAMAQQQKE